MSLSKILFIGHSTIDLIKLGGNTSRIPGGGVYFGAVAAGCCLNYHQKPNVELNVLSIGLKNDFEKIQEEFDSLKVGLLLLEDSKTTTFVHSFKDDNPDQRVSSVAEVARSFEERDFDNKAADIFYVNPLFYGEIDATLFPILKSKCKILSVDAQGLLRNRNGEELFLKPPDELDAILANVDILKVDSVEAEALTGIHDIEESCPKLLSKGPSFVLCTESSGVTVFTRDQKFRSIFTQWKLEGRTGRGDTVSASFILLHFIIGKGIQEALDIAAAGTSKKMMHAGASRLEDFDIETPDKKSGCCNLL